VQTGLKCQVDRETIYIQLPSPDANIRICSWFRVVWNDSKNDRQRFNLGYFYRIIYITGCVLYFHQFKTGISRRQFRDYIKNVQRRITLDNFLQVELLKTFFCFLYRREQGYIAGSSGTILNTSNGGSSWTRIMVGEPHNLTSLFLPVPIRAM